MDPLLVGILILLTLLLAVALMLALRLSRFDMSGHDMTGLQVELRGLAERVSHVEQSHNQAHYGLAAATNAIRDDLSRAHIGLAELQAYTRSRKELEERTADSVRRLEMVIAGTQTKGGAGENILEAVFSRLPADWQVRNMRVGDKVVEFGLRLPNGLVLPIDSKWSATSLLERFSETQDPDEQQRIKAQIEATVLSRAKEVRKYLDPNFTAGFCVAVVPDAVWDLSCGIQGEIFPMHVVLVSYSMFIPYLLLVFQTILKSEHSLDVQRLDAYLSSTQQCLQALQEELEGRYARAMTMLDNSRNDMAAHLSKLSAGLTSLRIETARIEAELLDEPASDSRSGSQ
ncbi:MAG: DNA recombination protein RmuC [Anaerolineae bacterium]